MLVLGLKRGERVILQTAQGEIAVQITEVVGTNLIRVGFDAPKIIPIVREELILREEVRNHRDKGRASQSDNRDTELAPHI